MARQAQVIMNIVPNTTQIDAALNRIQQRMSQMSQMRLTGTSGSGRGGAGGGGASSSASDGGFMQGWNRAGGLGAAIGTVTKFWLAYKVIDVPLRAINSAFDQSVKAIGAATNALADYEDQVASTARTMRQPGFTTMGLKNIMGVDALSFITRYRVTMEEAAKAQYELGSAGFTAAQALQTYQVPLKVAIGLQSDITQTTQFMTQMLKIHGDQMGENLTDYDKMVRIGAVLARTWEIEQVEISDLAAAYKYIAGTATAMKLPLEQLIPTLGFLSTYGQRGSIGGTGLNQFFTQMSRSIQITNGQIEGLKKSARGMEHVINLKPGKYTPFDLLVQLAQAGSKIKGMDDAGWARLSKAFNDIFNIRGARPAQLLADMNKLQQLMKNIAEITGLTTKENEKLIDSFVDLMQNTPNAQLQIMHNNLYVLGVKFMEAATGANSLTGTLITLNDRLRSMDGFVANVGVNLRVMGGAFQKAWENSQTGNDWVEKVPLLGNVLDFIVEYNRAKPNERADAYKEQAGRVAVEAYSNALSQGKTDWWARYSAQQHVIRWAKDKSWELTDNPKITPDSPEYKMIEWILLLNPIWRKDWVTLQTPQEKWLNEALGRYNEEQKGQQLANMFQQGMNPYSNYPNYQGTSTGAGGGSGLWDPSSVAGYKLSRAQKLSWDKASQGTHREAGVFDILLSEIISKGDNVKIALHKLAMEGALGAFRPAKSGVWPAHIHGVFPDMAPKEGARIAKQLGIDLGAWLQKYGRPMTGFRDMWEQIARLQLQTLADKFALGQAVPGSVRYPLESYEKDLSQMLDQKGLPVGVRAQIAQSLRGVQSQQIARMGDKYAMYTAMPGLAADLGMKFPMDWYKSNLQSKLKQKDLTFEQKADIVGRLGAIEQTEHGNLMTSFERRMRSQKEMLTPITDERLRLQQVTQQLNNEESVYGKTIGLTNRQMANAEEIILALNRERQKQADFQKEIGGTLAVAQDQLDILEQQFGKDSQKYKDQESLVNTLKDAYNGYKESIRSLDSDVMNFSTNTLPLLKRQLEDLPMQRFGEDIDRIINRNQAMFSARGWNYEMSDTRLKDINLKRLQNTARLVQLGVKMTEDPFHASAYGKEFRQLTEDNRQLGYDEESIRRMKADYASDTDLKIMQTRLGWVRGTPRQMARAQITSGNLALDLELSRMRREMAMVPDAESIIKNYEQTMRAEIIARPWLDARDRIQQEWTGMFQNVFAALAEGDNPFRAVDSIIKSMQGQMIQNWASRNLGGFFDQLATKETGIAKPDAVSAMAEFSSSATMGSNSLMTFTGAVDAAAMALNNLATGAVAGVPLGMAGNIGGFTAPADLLVSKFDKVFGKVLNGTNKTPAMQPKGALGKDLIQGIMNYSGASMFAGMAGGMLGRDPSSSAVAGGLGYAAGVALGLGPVGAIALGIGSILGFGKKKKKEPPPDPQRNMYGMPAFEWDAYMYNLYTRSSDFQGMDSGRSLNTNIGQVVINVNGGDTKEVKRVVTEVLNGQFGTIAQVKARTGSY